MKVDPIVFNDPLVNVKWLSENLSATNLVILDATINKRIESTSIRIPKARFFDIKNKFSDTSAPFPSTLPSIEQFELEAQRLGINDDSLIVVYDDKGIYSSARAWWLFKTFGFENVAVLDGGLPKWVGKGYLTEAYANEVYPKGRFKANVQPSLMTNFNNINEFIENEAVSIVDARSRARYNCEVDEPREGLRRGIIPNSLNLPYTDLLNGHALKPKNELEAMFNSISKHKSNQMVFSCGSGITACILALGATICNYKNLTVYDGSWTEYGTLT